MLPPRDNLTAEYVRSLLDYDPDTGVFIWCVRPDQRREWNTRYAGYLAGCPGVNGYWQLTIDDVHYLAHRVAWLFVHGYWPPEQVDHIDGNRMNNAILNLRPAAHSENLHNRGAQKNNRSGLKGVSRRPSGKWYARIAVNGKHSYLGNFDSAEKAHGAYCAAAVELHREFARSS